MNYNTITITDLINDAKARGYEAMNCLKELVSATTVDEDGNEASLSFITIKREYLKRFNPQVLPKAKIRKPSMKELVMAM